MFGAVSVLVCLLTQKMNMIGAMMMGMVVSMGSAVMSLFGIPALTVWSLMEQTSLPQCCALVMWMIAGWYTTVQLWIGNGRIRK